VCTCRHGSIACRVHLPMDPGNPVGLGTCIQTRESKVSPGRAIPARDKKEKVGTSYPMWEAAPPSRGLHDASCWGHGWSNGAFLG
jgi:hypothetical protein